MAARADHIIRQEQARSALICRAWVLRDPITKEVYDGPDGMVKFLMGYHNHMDDEGVRGLDNDARKAELKAELATPSRLLVKLISAMTPDGKIPPIGEGLEGEELALTEMYAGFLNFVPGELHPLRNAESNKEVRLAARYVGSYLGFHILPAIEDRLGVVYECFGNYMLVGLNDGKYFRQQLVGLQTAHQREMEDMQAAHQREMDVLKREMDDLQAARQREMDESAEYEKELAEVNASNEALEEEIRRLSQQLEQ